MMMTRREHRHWRRDRLRRERPAVFGAIMIALLLGIGATIIVLWHIERTETCTVIEKTQITAPADSAQPSTYRIATRECGVMEVGDSLLKLKFNSADVYHSIEVGNIYNMTVIGWRNGFFSLFPTIIEAERATAGEAS